MIKARERKMVVVGDSGVGKSSLLARMAGRSFTSSYRPYTDGGHTEWMGLNDGGLLRLVFWDTYGAEDHDSLRPLAYPDTAVLLVCFAVDNPTSFLNVTQRWLPETLHFCSAPNVPILLVGCKTDLRDTQWTSCDSRSGIRGGKWVSMDEASTLANHIGAIHYMECSSRDGGGVDDILLSAGEIAASWDPKHSPLLSQPPGCIII